MEPVVNTSPAGLVPTLSKMGNLSFLNLVPLDTNPASDPCHWNFLDQRSDNSGELRCRLPI